MVSSEDVVERRMLKAAACANGTLRGASGQCIRVRHCCPRLRPEHKGNTLPSWTRASAQGCGTAAFLLNVDALYLRRIVLMCSAVTQVNYLFPKSPWLYR